MQEWLDRLPISIPESVVFFKGEPVLNLGQSELKFSVGPVGLPPATDGGYHKFEVKTMIEDDAYDVDHTYKLKPFLLTAGSFSSIQILPKSYHAQKKTVYTFKLNPFN